MNKDQNHVNKQITQLQMYDVIACYVSNEE